MAVRPVVLWNSYDEVELGRIYFNTSTRLWYSDSDCTHNITQVPIPRRTCYTFLSYHLSSTTGTKYIDENGNIIVTPSWTTSTEVKLYSKWQIFSVGFTFDELPDGAIARDGTIYRSYAASNQFYKNPELTDGPITKITPPYQTQKAFNGCYWTPTGGSQVDFLDKDGNILVNGWAKTWQPSTPASVCTIARGSQCHFYVCYRATLNANGGTGGEVDPIWYNRVQGWWAQDDSMLYRRERIALPRQSGKIFTGYYTTASGGTKTINADGTFTLSNPPTSANTTYYAHWTNSVTVTLNNAGGSSELTKLYYGGGAWFDNATLDTPVTSISTPTLANNRFLGYFNGSTKVINADGTIVSSFAPSSAVTITAHWERVSYTIAIEAHGGTGIAAIYANAAKTAVYADEMCDGDPITAITPPVRPGYRFLGLYTEGAITATCLVDGEGAFTSAMSAFVAAITGNTTIHAIWQQVHTIALDPNGGAGSPGAIYYDDAFGLFYDDPAMVTPVTDITIPTLECYRFTGFASGGTTFIDASGHISPSWTPTADITLTAGWERRSWRFGLDANGGTGGTAVIYRNGGVDWYADDACAEIITHIQPPTRDGYTFAGFYTNNDPAQVVVDEDGLILATPALTQDNNTSKAIWTANTYTLTFDPNGGTTTTDSKTVTFGQPIGEIPTATRRNAIFLGWAVNGTTIASSTVWTIPNNARAVAVWELQFGDVVDYFGFASASLKPIASDSGDNRQRLCMYHTGKCDASEVSGVWRNPTVTYAVIRNMTLNVTLGHAFAGGLNASGYMITTAEVHTQVGQFPTVTISAVANEGRNAINLFPFSVSIVARSKAQNLMGAISGGGRLNAMSVIASCDPVVIAENMMPVASDVVHGKITASADTIVINHDNAPTAAGGFTEIGTPKQCTEAYYSKWHIDAERDI